MLYKGYFIIVSGHKFKKKSSKISHFRTIEGGKLLKQFVHKANVIEAHANNYFESSRGLPGLDGPSGHYMGPHGRSGTRIVTK